MTVNVYLKQSLNPTFLRKVRFNWSGNTVSCHASVTSQILSWQSFHIVGGSPQASQAGFMYARGENTEVCYLSILSQLLLDRIKLHSQRRRGSRTPYVCHIWVSSNAYNRCRAIGSFQSTMEFYLLLSCYIIYLLIQTKTISRSMPSPTY